MGNPKQQRNRVEQAVEKAYDGTAIAKFDENRPTDWLRFRIDDKRTKTMLSNGAIEYRVSEFADMSDQRLEAVVAALAPHFSRR